MVFSYFCSISSITNWERNSVTRLCLTLDTFCITLVLRLKFQIWFSTGSIFSFHMGKWIFEFFLSNQLLLFQSLNGKINFPWNLIHSSQATLDEGYLKYLRYHNHFYNFCWTNSFFTCCWYNFFVKGLMYLISTFLLQFW